MAVRQDQDVKRISIENDPYAILGLNKNDLTQEKLRKAYLKLVIKAHPDKGGSDELFQKLDSAYNALLIEITQNEKNVGRNYSSSSPASQPDSPVDRQKTQTNDFTPPSQASSAQQEQYHKPTPPAAEKPQEPDYEAIAERERKKAERIAKERAAQDRRWKMEEIFAAKAAAEAKKAQELKEQLAKSQQGFWPTVARIVGNVLSFFNRKNVRSANEENDIEFKAEAVDFSNLKGSTRQRENEEASANERMKSSRETANKANIDLSNKENESYSNRNRGLWSTYKRQRSGSNNENNFSKRPRNE